MKHTATLLAAASLLAASPAMASIVVNIDELGGNVIARTSGTIDLTGLTDDGDFNLLVGTWASAGYIGTGLGVGNVEGYFSPNGDFSGPGSFGTGPIINADSGTGDGFAINDSGFGTPYVFVPLGYTSGTLLTSTALFNGTTLAALGLTGGTYVFTLPSTDTVTVNIGLGAAAPEPATWTMMVAGFGLIGGAVRRRGGRAVAA